MRRLRRDGVALFYEEAGGGEPPMLLVHGLACDHTHLTPQLEHFSGDHRVVAVDLRGHGQSDAPHQEYTIEGFADDLAWVCARLGLENPIVVGHSLGGEICLALASSYPELPVAVVAMDATIVPPQDRLEMMRPYIERLRTPAYPEELRRFLRVAGAEVRAFAVWAEQYSVQKSNAVKAQSAANAVAVFNSASSVLTSMVIFASVAYFMGGSVSTGDFVAFNTAFAQFLFASAGITTAVVTILQAAPFYERAKPILRTLPEVDTQLPDPGELRGRVEVHHVYFRYDPDGPLVLDDVSIRAEPGEFIAIVGPSGAGKSSLLRQLLGFEEPESGSTFFDDHDLAGLNVQAVRHQMGVVLQNGRLMSGTIYQNIAGVSQLTMEGAWEAARMAGLDRDIEMMPMGMFTFLGEGASAISGGQRQRLMIARAIASKPRILLFDEATSALDNRTQAIVSASLQNLKATRIVIAHRLSTIMNADRIYVLKEGRIVQSGTYAELMEQEGPFRDLAARQIA